jgi:rhombotail lipoprotein
MSPLHRTLKVAFCVVVVFLALTGCAGQVTRHNSSSVVTYLYPDQNKPIETASIPRLSLPLRVGIAFVPEGSMHNPNFTEKEKSRLANEIAGHFKQHDFVSSIEIIPSPYLRPNGSFTNLDQIRTMHGIDVIALLSYDQTQFTDRDFASISYWTLVGAYVIPGEKNDTHTMVDAVVYELESRKMLFRAPGISHIKGRTSPVNLSEELREDSLQGFQIASENLIQNLDEQLASFKQRVKDHPQEYQIVRKPGYTGGGSVDAGFLMLTAFFGLGAGLRRMRARGRLA